MSKKWIPMRDEYMDDLKQVIEEQYGLIWAISKVTGLPIRTLELYIDKFGLRELLEKSKENMTNLAEAKLNEHMANGSLTAIRYYLDRRSSAYRPKQEIENNQSISIQPAQRKELTLSEEKAIDYDKKD